MTSNTTCKVGLHVFEHVSSILCLSPPVSARVPIRGAGDGMEMEKKPSVLEIKTDTLPPGPSTVPLLKVASTKSPHPPLPVGRQPLGVLHLGKVSREACTEVEAVRIVVPRAAISRSKRAGPTEEKGEAEEQGSPPLPLVEDWRGQLEKLQNSERRLLQDKEGLCNQLRVQTEVRLKLGRYRCFLHTLGFVQLCFMLMNFMVQFKFAGFLIFYQTYQLG